MRLQLDGQYNHTRALTRVYRVEGFPPHSRDFLHALLAKLPAGYTGCIPSTGYIHITRQLPAQ